MHACMTNQGTASAEGLQWNRLGGGTPAVVKPLSNLSAVFLSNVFTKNWGGFFVFLLPQSDSAHMRTDWFANTKSQHENQSTRHNSLHNSTFTIKDNA